MTGPGTYDDGRLSSEAAGGEVGQPGPPPGPFFPAGPDSPRVQPSTMTEPLRRTVLPGRTPAAADGDAREVGAERDQAGADPRGEPTQVGATIPERLQPSPGIAPRPHRPEPPQEAVTAPSRQAQYGGPGATTLPPAGPRTQPGGTAQPVRRGPRRARLAVKRVDPWSVMKFTLVYSTALLIVFVVAVVALYAVLAAMGVFDSVNSFLRDVSGSSGTLTSYVSFPRVVGGAILIGAVNVVLFTAFATLGAFVYNLCADLVGGIELTLSERE